MCTWEILFESLTSQCCVEITHLYHISVFCGNQPLSAHCLVWTADKYTNTILLFYTFFILPESVYNYDNKFQSILAKYTQHLSFSND